MKCQRCKSKRMGEIGAKTNDRNGGCISDKGFEGYLPRGIGIGGDFEEDLEDRELMLRAGDRIWFDWCLDCGQIQGEFPLPVTEFELGESDE